MIRRQTHVFWNCSHPLSSVQLSYTRNEITVSISLWCLNYHRPQTKLRQGNVFIGVWLSTGGISWEYAQKVCLGEWMVCPGEVGMSGGGYYVHEVGMSGVGLGWVCSGVWVPPDMGPGSGYVQREWVPTHCSVIWYHGIWLASGLHASYCNAFLFTHIFAWNKD